MYSVDGNAYNRFTNLDNVEWNIIWHLVNSETKFADMIWKILKYDTEDCLLRDSVSRQDRINLIYTNNGDASVKRVFMTPYIDDAWDVQSSHLHVYVDTLTPRDHLASVLDVTFETIVHNKISNIIADGADGEKFGVEGGECNLGKTNPVEFDENGQPWCTYKSRATVFLKSVLAEFNGTCVNGVGTLQFNSKLSPYSKAENYLWNGRKFYGHITTMSTILSGVSDNNGVGY